MGGEERKSGKVLRVQGYLGKYENTVWKKIFFREIIIKLVFFYKGVAIIQIKQDYSDNFLNSNFGVANFLIQTFEVAIL